MGCLRPREGAWLAQGRTAGPAQSWPLSGVMGLARAKPTPACCVTLDETLPCSFTLLLLKEMTRLLPVSKASAF